jgi:hypothetical protein
MHRGMNCKGVPQMGRQSLTTKNFHEKVAHTRVHVQLIERG